jgi:tRNA G37 N-methylase TrmD
MCHYDFGLLFERGTQSLSSNSNTQGLNRGRLRYRLMLCHYAVLFVMMAPHGSWGNQPRLQDMVRARKLVIICLHFYL